MSDDLTFLMGKFEARIPTDRSYTRSHMWMTERGDLFRVGLTAYAVRLLQDVYFLDWTIDPESTVQHKQEIGQIESSKAVSALYAPAAGHIVRFNEELLRDPSLINTANYEEGWLFEFQSTVALLTPAEYFSHLEATWETTQRLLKSQYNE